MSATSGAERNRPGHSALRRAIRWTLTMPWFVRHRRLRLRGMLRPNVVRCADGNGRSVPGRTVTGPMRGPVESLDALPGGDAEYVDWQAPTATKPGTEQTQCLTGEACRDRYARMRVLEAEMPQDLPCLLLRRSLPLDELGEHGLEHASQSLHLSFRRQILSEKEVLERGDVIVGEPFEVPSDERTVQVRVS